MKDSTVTNLIGRKKRRLSIQSALLFVFLFATHSLFAQKILTIEECQQKARDNYPLIRQHGLINLSEKYTLSSVSMAWYPQITFNAQATYQTDVTRIPFSVPNINIPTMDKDQYRVSFDVSQTIWDGGATRSLERVAEASFELDHQNLEVTLYTLRERVNQLFFGVLTVDEQLKQLDILEKDLQAGRTLVNTLLQNGTAMQSEVDVVQVEILNTSQKRTELTALRKAFANMLSAMIGETVDDNASLAKPEEPAANRLAGITRPEMLLFTRQKDLFDAQLKNIADRAAPKLSLFVQGGYGKPGLNMLSNRFDFFALGGIKLKWDFGNMYSSRIEITLLKNNKKILDVQQETFLFNTNLQLTQAWQEIQKTKELMQTDDEIIQLRHRVKTAGESKYANGVYTVNDLVKDINAENQSRQAKILHEVQYLMSVYQYKVIAGD